MGLWTVLNTAAVLNAMPTDYAVAYQEWIDIYLDKADRLEEVTLECVAMFRAAVASRPENVMDDQTDTVPTSGYAHAMDWILFKIGMEMGLAMDPNASNVITRTDIWLRMVQAGSIWPLGASATTAGTPSYSVPSERDPVVRSLAW